MPSVGESGVCRHQAYRLIQSSAGSEEDALSSSCSEEEDSLSSSSEDDDSSDSESSYEFILDAPLAEHHHFVQFRIVDGLAVIGDDLGEGERTEETF